MDYVEAEGASVDEAIDNALQRLGTTRDKATIEIISTGTRGLFGLGGRKARVKATIRATVTPGQTASQRQDLRSETAPHGAPPSGAEVAQQPTAQPSRRSLDEARTVLAKMIALMGMEATVEIANADDSANLVISGDVSGTLIGRRGQTLDALEYIVTRIATREDNQGGRITLDSQNYRTRRRQALEDLAKRLGERARSRGRTIALNPMNPRDRRIVHLTLQNDPGLVTKSSGKGYFRKLLIIPEGDTSKRRREEEADC